MTSPFPTTQTPPRTEPMIIELEKMYKFPAGAVDFGVIYRQFTEAAMLKYEGRPGVAEILKKIREENYFDQGVSIYVYEAGTSRDYLRFCCFEREPHYHYHHLHALKDAGVEISMETLTIGGHAECVTMNGHWHQVPFDPAANGDIRVWALDKLRNRLGPMLCEAGVPALAGMLDPEACSAAIDAMEPYVFGVLAK